MFSQASEEGDELEIKYRGMTETEYFKTAHCVKKLKRMIMGDLGVQVSVLCSNNTLQGTHQILADSLKMFRDFCTFPGLALTVTITFVKSNPFIHNTMHL